MLVANAPITGHRKSGKLITRDNFPEKLRKVLRPIKGEKRAGFDENQEDEREEEREDQGEEREEEREDQEEEREEEVQATSAANATTVAVLDEEPESPCAATATAVAVLDDDPVATAVATAVAEDSAQEFRTPPVATRERRTPPWNRRPQNREEYLSQMNDFRRRIAERRQANAAAAKATAEAAAEGVDNEDDYEWPASARTKKKITFGIADQRRIAFRAMLDALGIPYDEIGTHSYRKGSASAAASGSTAAPPIIAICLRAGWKLGGVLNTYLSLESAGDRFVGRICALLPQMSAKFGVLPPAFPERLWTVQSLLNEDDERARMLIEQAMVAMFGRYRYFGGSFACVLRHCLATMCYQKEFLTELPSSHPWHSTWLGKHPAEHEKLRNLVGPLRYDGDETPDGEILSGSGIPPWTKFHSRMDVLERLVRELPKRFEETTIRLMEEHGVRGGNVTQGNAVVIFFFISIWRKLA